MIFQFQCKHKFGTNTLIKVLGVAVVHHLPQLNMRALQNLHVDLASPIH